MPKIGKTFWLRMPIACINIAPRRRPIAIVNPDDSSYEGEHLAEGGEDRRVNHSHGWHPESRRNEQKPHHERSRGEA